MENEMKTTIVLIGGYIGNLSGLKDLQFEYLGPEGKV